MNNACKFIILITVILLFLFYYFYNPRIYNPSNNNVPKIIHLIYIPWDKNQKLKDNYLDFDKKSYEELTDSNKDYIVKLWTLPYIKEFIKQYYPQYYDLIFNLPRPVMIVDIVRLLLVYHYGGIYWQYGSKRTVDKMDYFLPSYNKKVKLFTETIITPEYSKKMGENEEIRDGEPEELIRVFTGFFSAEPKHPYILTLFLTAVSNCKMYKINKDYDILYVTGNAMMSKMYDKIGKHMKDVELVDNDKVKRMISVRSNGSWRTDIKS